MTATTTTAIPPAYTIRRLYLKGASVEVPHMDRMPRAAVQPVIGIDVQTEAHEGWPGTLECVLRMTLQARVGDTTAFVIEVNEAGVFELPGTLSQDGLTRFVRKTAPGILFPMARRDLAAMAVAAGFQPVLLDHIDFDALVTEVVKREWARLTPAPVSVATDVLAAAAAAHAQVREPDRPAPVIRVERAAPADVTASPGTGTGDEERPAAGAAADTEPSWLDTQPVAPVIQQRRKRAPWLVLSAVVLAAIAAGGWWWQRGQRPAAPAHSAAPVAAAPARAAASATPASPAARVGVLPGATREALEDSRQRLAALPADWRSIELGVMEADSDLRPLAMLPLQAPLYLSRLPDGQLQVLYGAFPSQDAAEAALDGTRAWKVKGLRGEPKVVRLRGSS